MSQHPDHDDHEVTEMTERLLRSWRADAAPSGAKRAAMAALGVGLAASATTGTVSALGGAARAGALGIVKALAGGALAGVVVVGTSTYVQRARAPEHSSAPLAKIATVSPASPVRSNVAPAAAPSDKTIEPAAAATVALPAPSPAHPKDDAPNAAVERAPMAAGTTALAPSPSPSSAAQGAAPLSDRPTSLAREIALLDESRATLGRGDAAGALKLLDRHAQEFPRGSLGPEAVVVRIEALLRLGDEHSARAIANQFATEHPDDSHLVRIKSLFANLKKPTGDRP
jgi:hypothetical protein